MVELAPGQQSPVTDGAEPERLRAEMARLQRQVDRLRAANDELVREKRALRARLDAYVSRAQVSCVFGPLEMTAGTHVGPRPHGGRPGQS